MKSQLIYLFPHSKNTTSTLKQLMQKLRMIMAAATTIFQHVHVAGISTNFANERRLLNLPHLD